MITIDELNLMTQEYYDSLDSIPEEGKKMKLLPHFTMEEDTLDSLLDELNKKKPIMTIPDKKEEYDPDLVAMMNERLNKRRELERKGKIKVRI